MACFDERFMVTMLRWTARTIGVALLVLIAALAIEESGPNPLTVPLREHLLGMALLTMTFGLLTGWKWEGIGGLLILGGFALFTFVNRPFRLNIVIVAWLVTGLLYLICWWRTSRRSVGEDSDRMDGVTGTCIMKRFWIPLVFVLVHAALVVLVDASIALSPDPEAGMMWRIFFDIDYPISQCIDSLPPIFSSNTLIVLTILVVGTIQWSIVGLVLQQVVKWLHC